MISRPPARRRAGVAAPGLPVLLCLGVALTLAACQSSGASPGASTGGVGVGAGGGASTLGSGTSASAAPGGSAGAGASGGNGSAGGTTNQGATALESAFEQVVGAVGPSVVVIETSAGLGSGIVFDTQGDIVTNAHVVGDATAFKVTTSAGKALDGTLIGSFAPDDVAVIRVKDGSLPAATFGDSSKAMVGEIVLAVGNPLGLQSSVTEGIVSAVGRTVSESGAATLAGMIQTSAAINPGNSGGALVDLRDEVIGIPTLAATDPELGGPAPGIGFAIPANTAVDIAKQLIQNGKVVASHRAYLGVLAANVESGQGVLVFREEAGGPAAKAGIPEGVLITAINGTAITDTSSLAAVLASLQPGQTVDIAITRQDGTTATLKVTLGELPG
jgi:putative serine protease PepD